jgi:hypothetical protein
MAKRILRLTESEFKSFINKVINEQAVMGNPDVKAQLKPKKTNQKVPYKVGSGWWTGTNVEKFVKSYTKEPNLGGQGDDYIWGTVGNVDWNFKQDGSFFTSKIGDVDEIEKGTWKDSGGTIVITLGNKKFDSKDNKWSNDISTVNCAPQLVDTSKGKVLKFGCKTQGVKELQNMLDMTNPTGYFGSITKQKVIDFQTKNNLVKKEGIVGPETYAALVQSVNVKKDDTSGLGVDDNFPEQ